MNEIVAFDDSHDRVSERRAQEDLRALFVPHMSRMIARTILEQAVLNSIEQGYTAEQIIDEVVKTLGRDEA